MDVCTLQSRPASSSAFRSGRAPPPAFVAIADFRKKQPPERKTKRPPKEIVNYKNHLRGVCVCVCGWGAGWGGEATTLRHHPRRGPTTTGEGKGSKRLISLERHQHFHHHLFQCLRAATSHQRHRHLLPPPPHRPPPRRRRHHHHHHHHRRERRDFLPSGPDARPPRGEGRAARRAPLSR